MAIFRKKGNILPDYGEKSQRINAWSNLIKSIGKLFWFFAFIIVLGILGKLFIFKGEKEQNPTKPLKKQVVVKVDWSKIDKDIEKKMVETRVEIQKFASEKLNRWIIKNMERVDNDFLDWYFSYWTQQGLGLQGLLAEVLHWVDDDNPSAAEKLTQVVQEEFTARVLRPQIAQMEIERIINEIVSQFSSNLKKKLDRIPQDYEINPVAWERYLEDVSLLVKNVEANRSTPISLKAIVGISAGGTLILIKSLKSVVTKIGTKLSTKLAVKNAAKMAAKTGGKVALKSGGKFLGTIVAIGIIIWDVWDHHATAGKARPLLRQNIEDYFNEVKESILHDPEFGVMTIIFELEKSISRQLK